MSGDSARLVASLQQQVAALKQQNAALQACPLSVPPENLISKLIPTRVDFQVVVVRAMQARQREASTVAREEQAKMRAGSGIS